MADKDRGKKSLSVQKPIPGEEHDDVLLEAVLPSKIEAWCGDTQTKICYQLTRDGIDFTFSPCTICMMKWCREANSTKSKSLIISSEKSKTWLLSIVEEEPKDVKQVEMDVCRDESEEYRKKIKQRENNNKLYLFEAIYSSKVLVSESREDGNDLYP
jgi:hypothetical protein